MHRTLRLAFSLAIGLLAASAHAVDRHLYRGGEDDLPHPSGSRISLTQDGGTIPTDLVGLNGVTINLGATSHSGSSYFYGFDGTGSLTGAVDTGLTPTSSFAMEVWFLASSPSFPQALIYNGNTGNTGIGLYLYQGCLQGLRGGVAFDPTAFAPQAGQWNHAALVYDAGLIRIYHNGSQIFSTTATFNAVNGSGADRLVLGSNNVGGDRFAGSLDEARVFSFPTGTFTPSLLHYPLTPIPEPAAFAPLAGLAALALAVTRRRRRTM